MREQTARRSGKAQSAPPSVSERVTERLAPYLGEFNAQIWVKVVAERELGLGQDEIRVEHLPPQCRCGETTPPLFNTEAIVPLEQVETRYLQWANAHFEGDKEALAEALGLSPRTLYRKLRQARGRTTGSAADQGHQFDEGHHG